MQTPRFNLLDNPLISARCVNDQQKQAKPQQKLFTLPTLLQALSQDQIHDFPALRTHQRHPWYAFLVHIAALAAHQAEHQAGSQTDPKALALFSSHEWKQALLALTPDHPDGAAWCLVSAHEQPAFMQAPISISGDDINTWKSLSAADELDMLVTAKNHDLKAARMRRAKPEDWLFALISLQTQEGFLGAGNFGISRMNGGFASRPAVGLVPPGAYGSRWQRDVSTLLTQRQTIANAQSLPTEGGHALLWLNAWDGQSSLAFTTLDPLYIEICRRIRFVFDEKTQTMHARAIGSKVARIDAKSRNGLTGDAWVPIDRAAAKALSITHKGFDYPLAAELLFGSKYQPTISQAIFADDIGQDLSLFMQGVTRGQGKTEGYHERHIPISPKARRLLQKRDTQSLASLATERIDAIASIRAILWTALASLFDQGADKDKFSDAAKDKATVFSKPFEQGEDARFFIELNKEIEADDSARQEQRLNWLLSLKDRAEALLRNAFSAGPQSGEQRYRAQAAALSRFHQGLRGKTSPSALRDYFSQQKTQQELTHE